MGDLGPAAVLIAEGLGYTYPNVAGPVLEDVSLLVRRGEFVALAGPSGSGKSTLLRCFLGLIPHLYGGSLIGRVSSLGVDVVQTLPHRLAPRLGMVFQNPEDQLVATMIEADVAFGPENLGLSRDEVVRRVENALSATGIEHLRGRSVHEISAGQQQKVALAGILALQPDVLLLDEPTSQLDPRSAGELLGLLHRLNAEQGLTVVLAEHRLERVLPLASRLIVMSEGRIRLDGTPREVIRHAVMAGIGVGVPRIVALFCSSDGLLAGSPLPLSVEEGAGLIVRRLCA